MTNKNAPVGILGAGITGLSTAYALQKKGIDVTVYEKSDKVGGAIQSAKKDGWLVEEGPNTLMIKSQPLWDLLEELQLGPELIEANTAALKRYVVKQSNLVALPSSIAKFLTTPLLSASAKLQLLKEPFMGASDNQDESIASFIKRRLGKQPLDYAVNPFVSGIYAGDPKVLSMKHTFSSLWEMEQQHGSITMGMFKNDREENTTKRALISFHKGNQTLPKALAKKLSHPVQTSTNITSAKQKNKRWMVKGLSSNQSFKAEHDCLISTVPAYGLPGIFESDLFSEISDLPYAPMSVLALGFKEEHINHPLNGFGMLIPEVENYHTLGVLFSSTLFPGRAPDGHQLLTCFIGGARDPEIARKSKEKLQSVVLTELDELLEVSESPVFAHHTYWDHAIPQYNVGYDHYLSLFEEIESKYPGLYLAGNFRGGVSVPDCISAGFQTAQKIEPYL